MGFGGQAWLLQPQARGASGCPAAVPLVVSFDALIAAFFILKGGCGRVGESPRQLTSGSQRTGVCGRQLSSPKVLQLPYSSAISRRLQTLELARCKANSRPGTVPCLPFRAVLLWLPADLETVKISLWDKATARWSAGCGDGGPHPPPRPAYPPAGLLLIV